MDTNEFHNYNVQRNLEWDPQRLFTVEFFGLALGGEVGELLNLLKKVARTNLGLRGSTATKEEIAEEIADVFIYLDLLTWRLNINLAKAVFDKFNASSEKMGLSVKLPKEILEEP